MSALSSLSFLYVTVLDFECSSSSFIDGVVIVLTYGRKQTNLLILKLKKVISSYFCLQLVFYCVCIILTKSAVCEI